VKPALQLLNKMLQADPLPEATYQAWREELDAQRTKFPMQYPDREDVIAPQHAVEVRARGKAGVYGRAQRFLLFVAKELL
jgi:hypothetical protein